MLKRLFGTIFLAFLCIGEPSISGQEPETKRRTFYVTIQDGEPGMEIVVESEAGGGYDQAAIASDDTFSVTLEVAETDILHFDCLVKGWRVKPDRKIIERAHRLIKTPRLITGLTLVPPPPSITPITPPVPPAGVSTDPCEIASSLSCQLYLVGLAEETIEEKNCSKTALVVDRMFNHDTGLRQSGAQLSFPIAVFFFDCGLASRFVKEVESYLQRVIDLVELEPNAWCNSESSQLLGASYEVLGKLEEATDSVDRARCLKSTTAIEWSFYFNLRLDRRDAAARLVEKVHGDLHDLLKAWLGRLEDQCPPTLDQWPRVDPLPCLGLPPRICLLQQARLLLKCGGGELAGVTYTLREALPEDFEDEQGPVPRELEDLVEEIAELEYERKSWDDAAELFLRLAQSDWTTREEEGRRWCRYGSALLRAKRQEDAQEAFSRARDFLPYGSLGHVIAFNNELVLAKRLGRTLEPVSLAALEEALDANGKSQDSDEKFWFEAIKLNLALLTRKESMDDPERGLREKVEYFRDANFLEVLNDALDIAHRRNPNISVSPCSALTIAGDLRGE